MFSIKDFFFKFAQIRSFLRIWSHLLKKPLMENFIICAVPRACLPLFCRIFRSKMIYIIVMLSDLQLSFFKLNTCLNHATSFYRSQPKDAYNVYAYIKEGFMLSYYAK